ncbi:translation elongation factor Ts [Oceanibacterium hippocampi]|uniref:Elongation factor Ts n=1 Tax=Oceanibacterium hippocampi TaxID=745714 RepID=A0A1Y5T1N9_9PROT|nr:translation elongation factor Ts [Oceanibacterium hippocampi]SLN53964.1 Elongation factor Ts [Oceanibacterium hippocampi]
MAEITAALVKELRTRSGAGMMDCKKALVENDGDLEAAIDWLRTKGLATAAKKAGRVAAEGLVGVATGPTAAAVVEINSETDFVARNEAFQTLVSTVAEIALSNAGDHDRTMAAAYPGTGRTVAEEVTNAIAKIGENMNFRRSTQIAVSDGVVSAYVHSAAAPGLGKIGVLVGLESSGDKAKLAELGKGIAMHIAATNPQSVSTADLDQTLVERERAVLSEQARDSGKPEEIIAKMVEGRLRKFYEEVVLTEQTYVIDGETRIAKVVEQAAKDLGTPVKIAGFARFAVGEGIEKDEGDFAAEVAAVAG